MRSEYLMFVSQENNNKWYRMTERDDGTFLAQWGRVGSEGQSKAYPVDKWDSQLRSKLDKGYTRVAGHGVGEEVGSIRADDIDVANDDVKELTAFLLKSSRQTVSLNYISAGDVTEAQIEQARVLIGSANKWAGSPAKEVNAILEKLYRTIPRKMKDTRSFFLRDDYRVQFLVELLQSEQSLLDTLESQLQHDRSVGKGGITLGSLGLDIRVATAKERREIAGSTDFKLGRNKVFRVVNAEADRNFPSGGNVRLLYHGTLNGNWLSVLRQGLRIRPDGVPYTGSMFGNGIYFANKAIKSIGYTSLKGSFWARGGESRAYLSLFEVAVGREWDLLKGRSHSSWMTRIDQKMVNAKGYDSVFCRGGYDLRNDENVIYDASRCKIKYLIELTA
jgi:poly [ADP-ribose] polymerase